MNGTQYNPEILEYIQSIVDKIKHKPHSEDVFQDVCTIILEKQIQNVPLDDGLKNYIKGIVWNVSTTFYNKMVNSNLTFVGHSAKLSYNYIQAADEPQEVHSYEIQIPGAVPRETPKDHELQLAEMYRTIRNYVFQNYYVTGKSLTRWKVWFLRLRNEPYDAIYQRIGVTYHSALQYNYLCNAEIKKHLGYSYSDQLDS